MLQYKYIDCMVGDCLRYIQSYGCMISRVKTMQLGVYAHPHPYISIGWWYQPSGQYMCFILFLCHFVIAEWVLMVGGAVGR